ncbi:urea transporter [Chryseobacterium sp. A321]
MTTLKSILRGIGQIMFQNNSFSGLLFLLGVLYSAPQLAAAAVVGTLLSTGTAQLLGYSKQDIREGLYGFNGALTGIAIGYFFGFTLTTVSVLILGAALTSPLSFYLKKVIPPYTAPFVLVTWISMAVLLFLFKIPLLAFPLPLDMPLDLFAATAKSFGQVLFQENSVTGILFLLGLLLNSKTAAMYGLYAAILGTLIALLLREPISGLNAGLMGYNAILCAIALADSKRSSFVWISIATLLSVLLNIGLAKAGIITLTAPFILSTWMVLKLKSIQNRSTPLAPLA